MESNITSLAIFIAQQAGNQISALEKDYHIMIPIQYNPILFCIDLNHYNKQVCQ